ncbi:helix-turn-helix transcriptional regulator [Agromyces sp. ISL-38]|uniref:PadR family transcriptional regulator n=1 Tax=Agromyces sp. ISL-38 TaxID=2819107 RepID=UPI001BE67A8A|nr:helix-turn-helix transcriptional regulator [Agromyces sp. ISL-38]MBT2500864.1 helix-turn-helix transcriptional regulator [Agromyces sp. ISL-38]MBT2518833.1 helix-turn-helix transcriptional regulator [Streptomyces sp. ISL-90]
MAVRDALLALLTAGPAYGFQLHNGLEARTGGRRQVNVGQTYATLERLGKQRLIEPAGETDDGLPLYRLTARGTAAATAWFDGADASGADPWDETVDRVLIALSLPDVDGLAVARAEIARWRVRRDDASTVSSSSEPAAPADGVETEADVRGAESELARLAAAAEVAVADAALGWLEGVAAASAERLAFAPRATRPKRGRRPSPPATD